MKKISTLALALGVSTIGGLVLGQTAHADSSETTNAQVTVTAGDLTITNMKNLDFGTHTISGKDITDLNSTASVSIEDLRGSSSQGWTLTAKLQSGDFDGIGLRFSPEITDNIGVAVASDTQDLNIGAQTVASVSDEVIRDTEFDTSLVLNASLTIPAKTKASTYSTVIVWNLASTPESK